MQAATLLSRPSLNLQQPSTACNLLFLIKVASLCTVFATHRFLMQMMTPFQLANIVVQTYPWVPDTTVLLNVLAAQESQPSAIELLGFADGQTAADSGPPQQDLDGASALHGATQLSTAMHKVSATDGDSAGV